MDEVKRPIIIRGASEHNLQDVDVDLPHGGLIAISGVSGSGKTSLALDTVFAEARRRYLAALGSRRGGGVRRLAAPRVRRAEGLSPAVAIGQGGRGQNSRSTVGTVAGMYDYLRLLFARVGNRRCVNCSSPVLSHRFEEVLETATGLRDGTKLLVLAPRKTIGPETGAQILDWVDRAGYRRIRLNRELVLIDDIREINASDEVEVVVDRLVVKPETRRRLRGSLQAALEMGQGRVRLSAGEEFSFSVRPTCSSCGHPASELSPALFSFNSSYGACPDCRGLGTQSGISLDRVFDQGRCTIEDAVGSLWKEFAHSDLSEEIAKFCRRQEVDPEIAIGEWSEESLQLMWKGTSKRGGFRGLQARLERIRDMGNDEERAWLDQLVGDQDCPTCRGSRLTAEALAVDVCGFGVDQLCSLSIDGAIEAFSIMKFSGSSRAVGERLTGLIARNLAVLSQLGLGYVGLDRRSDSLSIGEFQRLRLATALESGMTQMMYVLDEPSVGLHERDVTNLLKALENLRDAGNTVVIVEHDRTLIEHSDHVVELGPGAGVHGGHIVASGSPSDVAATSSATGRYLTGKQALQRECARQPGKGGWLQLEGVSGHNLKQISVRFPLGNFTCVTGVSGSGKSTLISDTLYPILAKHLNRSEALPLPYESCHGLDHVNRVIAVDQRPIGRNPRSNAATYTGLLDHVRRLFAELPEARVRGYTPAHFSFNATEGACPECAGRGYEVVPQRMFEDLEVECGGCRGRRYKASVLEVSYRDRSVADVLSMTVEEALEMFTAVPELARRLDTLQQVGLGYLRLGQPATSFSGGEAQRVKLAAELSRPRSSHSLYILDEPTTGLHIEDVRHLVSLLGQLVDLGNTVIVVEHQIELIAVSDYVIDMGPEGGPEGGQVVAAGTPREIAGARESWTGRYLSQFFDEEHGK